jgi:hypothetical protein
VTAPASTYDPTLPVGQVRLLINDTDVNSDAGPVFTDAEITAFLTLNRSSVKRASAAALEVIAGDEALTSKVIRDHELQTDGAKLAAELRALAASLRAEAINDDTLTAGTPVYSFPDADAKIDPHAIGWL